MTAKLARNITWKSSKQTYLTARLLVDRGMTDDCYRAYGYFRWADDVIDDVCQTQAERLAFIQRQITLVDGLCRGEHFDELSPEEELIADLIDHERGESCKLRSYVRNFLAILEFDAWRKDRLISQEELTWYSDRLGVAVTDCIQHFIGHDHPYPDDERRYLAATAAHIVHMLRDMLGDIQEGYINIPRENLLSIRNISSGRSDQRPTVCADRAAPVIDPFSVCVSWEHGLETGSSEYSDPFFTGEDIDAKGVDSLSSLSEPVALHDFVKGQIELARKYFSAGKEYLDTLDVLRCKLAGHLYCLRFEGVMDAIENDGYLLRPEYGERHKLKTLLKALGVVVSVSTRHIFGQIWQERDGTVGEMTATV